MLSSNDDGKTNTRLEERLKLVQVKECVELLFLTLCERRLVSIISRVSSFQLPGGLGRHLYSSHAPVGEEWTRPFL